MTATQMQKKETNKIWLGEDEAAILFYRIIEAIRADWGTKKNVGLYPSRFSMRALFERVHKFDPTVLTSQDQVRHRSIAGADLSEGRDPGGRTKADEREVLLLLRWVQNEGWEWFPAVAELMEDDRHSFLLDRLNPGNVSDSLVLNLQRLQMELLEQKQKVLNLQHTANKKTVQTDILQAEKERLKQELSQRADAIEALASTLTELLARLESTTEDESTLQELATIRQQVDFLTH